MHTYIDAYMHACIHTHTHTGNTSVSLSLTHTLSFFCRQDNVTALKHTHTQIQTQETHLSLSHTFFSPSPGQRDRAQEHVGKGTGGANE
jgi:hypothetical protein